MPDGVMTKTTADTTQSRSQRITAVQQIYAALRSQIVTLELPPGTQLSKKDIAGEFGVSQTPVREALILLEEEGLVDIFPQSRTSVSFIDVQSAREAHFLRRSVEVEIVRTLAQSIEEVDLIDLRAILQRQAAYLRADDLKAFTDADNAFHHRLYEMADIPGLYDIINGRRAHLDRLRHLHLPKTGKAEAILNEHSLIVAALEAGDAGAAEKAVREHLKGTVSSTEEIRSHFPEYFN